MGTLVLCARVAKLRICSPVALPTGGRSSSGGSAKSAQHRAVGKHVNAIKRVSALFSGDICALLLVKLVGAVRRCLRCGCGGGGCSCCSGQDTCCKISRCIRSHHVVERIDSSVTLSAIYQQVWPKARKRRKRRGAIFSVACTSSISVVPVNGAISTTGVSVAVHVTFVWRDIQVDQVPQRTCGCRARSTCRTSYRIKHQDVVRPILRAPNRACQLPGTGGKEAV